MAFFGVGAIRGSSSRRSVSALIGMKKALSAGTDVCVTPDGPRGPRYVLQPGIIKIAQKTQAPIIPIHIQYSRAWRLSSWDRFVIPKPFSLVNITFDQPIRIPISLNSEELERYRKNLEVKLRIATDDLSSK